MEEHTSHPDHVARQTSTQPPVPPIDPEQKGKSTIVIVLLTLAAVAVIAGIGAGAFFLGKSTQNPQASTTPNVTPSQSAQQTAPTTQPTLAQEPQVAFTSKKIQDLSFPSYSITYPESWSKTEKSDQLTQSLTLTKSGATITISQAPTGGNACIFSGLVPEGPANDYRNSYSVDVVTGLGNMKRVGDAANSVNFSFCQESKSDPGFYFLPTNVGFISYKLPAGYSPQLVSEMDQVVASLKAN